MKTGKYVLFIITTLLSLLILQTAHSASTDKSVKETVNNLISAMQRKHLDSGKFLITIKKLIKSPDASQYLQHQLITILKKSPAAGSRMRAAWLLGEIKSRRAIPHLFSAKKDRHHWVRKAAEHALIKIR